MISPSILKQVAKDKEDENYKFRAFLKNQNDEEVDKLVHAYHKELYSEEFCKNCMNCCKECTVELDTEEEKAKPRACIEFPHTQKEGFVFRLLSVIDNYSICPVVFEIYERLKNQYCLDKRGGADYKRGEEILLRALNIPGLKDRDYVEERLLDLYKN